MVDHKDVRPAIDQRSRLLLKNRSSLLLTGLLFSALSLLSWTIDRVYSQYLTDVRRGQVIEQLLPLESQLTAGINRRLALLDGLHAFALTVESEQELAERFELFASELYADADGVRNFSLAPNAVQVYFFPLDDNEEMAGHDLTADSRPDVRADVLLAIASDHIVLSGPYELRQGGQGLIARRSIYRDGVYWGLATMAIDLPMIYNEARLRELSPEFDVAIRNGHGETFYGDEGVFQADSILFTFAVQSEEWALAVRPTAGWLGAHHLQIMLFRGMGGTIVILLSLLGFGILNHSQKLSEAVIRRTSSLQAELIERERREKILREQEQILRLVTQNMQDTVVAYTLDGKLYYANPAFETLTGYTIDVLKGPKPINYIHPDDQATLASVLRRLGQGETVSDVDYRIITRDGEVKWCRSTWGPLIDLDGVRIGSQGRATDITTHKLADEALHNQQRKLTTLFDVMPVGVSVVDKERNVLAFNPALTAILQLPGKAIEVGEFRQRRYIRPDGTPMPKEEFPTYRALAEQGQIENVEIGIITETGQVIWTMVSAALVDVADWAVVAITTDITERREMEGKLAQLARFNRRQAQEIQQTMDAVPQGMVVLQQDKRIRRLNPAAETLFAHLTSAGVGDPLTHLAGTPIETLLRPPSNGLWHELTLDTEPPRIIEVTARWLNFTAPEEMEGEVVNWRSDDSPEESAPSWLLILQDVTEQRTQQERIREHEKLATVGQLAAGIAHDFNNILGVITLYVDLLVKRSDVSSDVRGRLLTIQGQTRQAADLVQQILDFSRRTVLQREAIDLSAFLGDFHRLLTRTMPENVEVVLSSEIDSTTITADPNRIRQALLNLAINARDAMPGGGNLMLGAVRFTLEEGETPPMEEIAGGDWVRIQVVDTGEGISEKDLPHIFEPFFTTKQVGKGSGLGLAQVYGIVKQHAGHIHVASEPHHGTVVSLYFPANESPGG